LLAFIFNLLLLLWKITENIYHLLILFEIFSHAANAKSSTLPLPPHRPLSTIRDKERDRDRDGYYSDRNELIRERERERDRGYLSDHNARWVLKISQNSLFL